jgi:hypothetical protein
MQEYDFIPQLKVKSKRFWSDVGKRAKSQEADEIITYMCVMLEKAAASNNVRITRDDFVNYGKKIDLFPGVKQWFRRIKKYAKSQGVILEHYIISSGIREMIEGTPIADEFKKIFASSFIYDQHDVAKWPGLAINYTTKTQFLFRINKGVLNVWDNEKINKYVPKQDRPIPFNRIIYIGDGSTDVPCMKLVKDQEGHSIAVYKPNSRKKKLAKKLLSEDRVNYVLPADYSGGKQLDRKVKAIIRKIAADFMLQK